MPDIVRLAAFGRVSGVRLRGAFRLLAGALLAAALGAVPSSTATAHTEFDYSLPTDGASVPRPVDEITVAFTLPVTLVGNGFEVLDPQGNVLAPFAVTDDDTVFRLQLDPPIAGGEAAVRYEVRAEDGHVLTGGFRFTIDAPVPTTSPPTTPPTTPPATSPPTTPPVAISATAPVTQAPTPTATDPPTTAAAATDPTATTAAVVVDVASTIAPDDDTGGGASTIVIGGAALVALGAAAFLYVRSRRPADPGADSMA
jgi:copper transport protein